MTDPIFCTLCGSEAQEGHPKGMPMCRTCTRAYAMGQADIPPVIYHPVLTASMYDVLSALMENGMVIVEPIDDVLGWLEANLKQGEFFESLHSAFSNEGIMSHYWEIIAETIKGTFMGNDEYHTNREAREFFTAAIHKWKESHHEE